MNCPQCGDICRCPSEPLPSASPQWMTERESGRALDTAIDPKVFEPTAGQIFDARVHDPKSDVDSATAPDASAEDTSQDADNPAWRDEISARLNRYRARRKVRPPRYPSLNLRFDAPEFPASASASSGSSRAQFEPVSNHALALDGM